MIYQMADVAMNPRQTVGTIIGRPLELYFGMKGAEKRRRVVELLDEIELGERLSSTATRPSFQAGRNSASASHVPLRPNPS